jgi:hypothetical protein
VNHVPRSENCQLHQKKYSRPTRVEEKSVTTGLYLIGGGGRLNEKRINIPRVLASQRLSIKEVEAGLNFMRQDLGRLDLELKTL